MTKLKGWELHQTATFTGGTCKLHCPEGNHEMSITGITIVPLGEGQALEIRVPDGELPDWLIVVPAEGFMQSSCVIFQVEGSVDENEFLALLLDGYRALISSMGAAMILTPPYH